MPSWFLHLLVYDIYKGIDKLESGERVGYNNMIYHEHEVWVCVLCVSVCLLFECLCSLSLSLWCVGVSVCFVENACC